jgi:hypothetical protein
MVYWQVGRTGPGGLGHVPALPVSRMTRELLPGARVIHGPKSSPSSCVHRQTMQSGVH